MGVEPRRAYRALPGGNTTVRPARRPARRPKRPRPAWGALYGVVVATLVLGFILSVTARTERVEGVVEFGTAGAVFAAMAVWVRRNRAALDYFREDGRSTEDAETPRVLVARIVRSWRPQPAAVAAPAANRGETAHRDPMKRVVPLRPRRSERAPDDGDGR